MGKCVVCESGDCLGCKPICEKCETLTYFEKLLIMRIADIGFQLKNISDILEVEAKKR